MKTYKDKLKHFAKVLTGLDAPVAHYWRSVKEAPFIIWQEDTAVGLRSNNKTEETGPSGTVDLFTSEEFDPLIDNIENILDAATLFWKLESAQYEEETKMIHIEWRWWL